MILEQGSRILATGSSGALHPGAWIQDPDIAFLLRLGQGSGSWIQGRDPTPWAQHTLIQVYNVLF